MPCVVRLLALLSACAFLALALRAMPDRAECMAPDVHFQRSWIVTVHVAFAIAAIIAAFAFARPQPWLALAFIVVAHAWASHALERVELTHPTDHRARAVHLHGPWALMRTSAGEGASLLESFRFSR